ncbi:universal stress protein [Natronobeatus ordinarius]|uniref:universal stress protein n=1 Tax=Natronobeatus ordinarius TaxID=2963433 RepID=UPI0020CBDDBC|nr:universal stress protein [Natronobeatus ordinarius]
MYRRILLPTDGGEATDDALEHAVDLAGQYDAELHVLYVVDASVVTGDIEVGTIVEEFESAGEHILEDVAERAHEAGLERDRITTKLARGTPHRTILEYTADQDVDLIVMGTHGRTGIGRYLLGSVTERVVRLADVPVVTVRRANS